MRWVTTPGDERVDVHGPGHAKVEPTDDTAQAKWRVVWRAPDRTFVLFETDSRASAKKYMESVVR